MAVTWDETKPDGATQDIPVLDDEIRGLKISARQWMVVEHEGPTAVSHGKHKPGSAYGLVATKAAIQAISASDNSGKVGYATDTKELAISDGTDWVFASLKGGTTGTMQPWPTATPPANAFLCNGQAINRTTYSALFALIGTVFGPGDGSTTFNVPDLRGRTPFGVDATTDFDVIGETGGDKTHDHGAVTGANTLFQTNIQGGAAQSVAEDVHTHTIAADTHLPPYMALHWIIWT